MQVLFARAKNDRVPISAVARLVGNGSYNKAVKEELITKGWIDPQRDRMRNWSVALAGLALILGLVALAAGLFLLFTSLDRGTWWGIVTGATLSGGSAALAGVGLIAIIAAAFVSPLSNEGLQQMNSWKNFAAYLRNITRDRESLATTDTFELYLPYAAAFGMAAAWGKHFNKMGNVPVPEWFRGLDGLGDGSFVAVMAVLSAADSSAASAAGAGAAGASGGGASGAG
jgi:uncharacterized membrane protein